MVTALTAPSRASTRSMAASSSSVAETLPRRTRSARPRASYCSKSAKAFIHSSLTLPSPSSGGRGRLLFAECGGDFFYEGVERLELVLPEEHRRDEKQADAGLAELAELVLDLGDAAREHRVLGRSLVPAHALHEDLLDLVDLRAVFTEHRYHDGRAQDSLGIAPDGRAVLVEDLPLLRENVRAAPDVPVVGPARDDLERHLFAAAADHELGARLLDRLRHERRVVELVVLALEGRALLGPEHVQDLAGFIQTLEPLAHRIERQAVGLVLVLLPAGANAADEPATRDDVYVGRHLGQHRGMAVGIARDDRPDPHPLGERGQRRERRPALEHVADPVGGVRHEVVGDARRVPAGLLGVAPERLHVAPRGIAHAGENGEAHAGSLRKGLLLDLS